MLHAQRLFPVYRVSKTPESRAIGNRAPGIIVKDTDAGDIENHAAER